MADDDTQDQPAPEPEPEPTGDDLDADALKAALAAARKDAAKYRTKAKELEPLAQKAKDLEDAQRSDIDKATERATAAEQRAQAAELRALRLEVASDKGLTPAQAKRLMGDTREELEADADDLLSSFAPAQDDARGPARRPKETLRPGAVPDADDDQETDPAKLAARVRVGF